MMIIITGLQTGTTADTSAQRKSRINFKSKKFVIFFSLCAYSVNSVSLW
jgi:hypothetical protein